MYMSHDLNYLLPQCSRRHHRSDTKPNAPSRTAPTISACVLTSTIAAAAADGFAVLASAVLEEDDCIAPVVEAAEEVIADAVVEVGFEAPIADETEEEEEPEDNFEGATEELTEDTGAPEIGEEIDAAACDAVAAPFEAAIGETVDGTVAVTASTTTLLAVSVLGIFPLALGPLLGVSVWPPFCAL